MLVIDDEEDARRSLRRMLTGLEYRVVEAETGEQAVAWIEQGGFDVVVTDLMMPGMSGIELLRRIRQRDMDVPVIVLTGMPTLETAVSVVEHGGYRYLEKPASKAQLVEAVRNAVATYQLAVLKRRAFEEAQDAGVSRAADRDLNQRFDRALSGLWMAFQPIVRWPACEIFGHEALVRSSEATLGTPGLLFDAAERLGRVRELGRVIRRAVAEAPAPNDSSLAFVNVHSADLADDELYSAAAPLSRLAADVILEITERGSLEQISDLPERLARLRALGYRIAVDDLGAGYAGLKSFSQLEPDVVKLDMSLIRGIDASARKRSLVRSMVEVCTRDLGVRVVCEGVETEAERDALHELGAELLQGYLFSKPGRDFRGPSVFPPTV